MLIRKQDCVMDVDVEKTKAYSQSHSVCDSHGFLNKLLIKRGDL